MATGAPSKRIRLRTLATAAAWLLCAALPAGLPAPGGAEPLPYDAATDGGGSGIGHLPGQERGAAHGAGPPADPESIEGLWSRGEIAFKTGELAEALRLFEAARSRDERRGRSWSYIGGVHFAQGDFAGALEYFRRALELDPGDVRACNNLGTTLERLGDFAGAEAAYTRATSIDPSYALSHRNLGILHARRLGNPDAARRDWERYLELAPPGPGADEIRRELTGLPPAAPPPPASPPVPPAPPAPPAR